MLYRLVKSAPFEPLEHESSSALPHRANGNVTAASVVFALVFAVQEEQHANTSANYDVELLHHRDAHIEFIKSGEPHSDTLGSAIEVYP